MKSSAIARIVLFSIAIVILGGILVGGLTIHKVSTAVDWTQLFHSASGFGSIEGGTVASMGEVSPENVKNIEINWTSGSVTIQRADVDTISFAEDPGLDENQKMLWKLQGDTLVINNSRYRVVIGISKSKDLVVTVPMDWNCNDLEINCVSADTTLNSITANDVTINAVSGLCDFTGNCTIDKLTVETVDGDITYSGTLNKLNCEGVSADFRGTFIAVPHSIELSTVDGNIDLILPADAGFTAELDTISGKFTSNFDTVVSGSRYSCGNGACSIEVDGVSGNITINKAQ